jgi:hypothetical protein
LSTLSIPGIKVNKIRRQWILTMGIASCRRDKFCHLPEQLDYGPGAYPRVLRTQRVEGVRASLGSLRAVDFAVGYLG